MTSMTTPDDLHHLVDRIDPRHLAAAADALRPYTGTPPAMPTSLGTGHSLDGDLAEHAGDLAAQSADRN